MPKRLGFLVGKYRTAQFASDRNQIPPSSAIDDVKAVRLLSLEEAAAYVGIAPEHFRDLIPLSPVKLAGRELWDRSGLDAYVDVLGDGIDAIADIAQGGSRNIGMPKFVYRETVKNEIYLSFRSSDGFIRLPGSPPTEAFCSAYTRLLLSPDVLSGRFLAGSVCHTVSIYVQSAEFSQLSLATKIEYARFLDRFESAFGERQISQITIAIIDRIHERIHETPAMANNMITVLRNLFNFAQRRGLARINPTRGIRKLRGGGPYARWTDDQIANFRSANDKTFPIMCLALDLALYLALRRGDACALRWDNYDGNRLQITQRKTGTEISIPVHPDLRIALNRTVRRGPTVLTNAFGKPFDPCRFSFNFHRACQRAGLPQGLCFHGLRHTAASRLAELGAGCPEIQAVTGHKTLQQLERYLTQASQRVRADLAINRIPSRYADSRKMPPRIRAPRV